MTAGELFFVVMLAAPFVIFFGAAYGDYRAEGKWPWSRSKKDSVNSGAKFG